MRSARIPSDLEWLEEAAQRVGKHPATLRTWIRQDYLQKYKRPPDRRTYVSRSQLDELVARLPASS